MKKYLFFDLDGTLTDSGLGIIRSAKYALNRLGVDVEDEELLRPFIGPPLEDSFKMFYGFSDERAKEAVKVYRERYNVVGVYENEPYDGVEACLQALTEKGYVLVVATSKPLDMAMVVLRHFHLLHYFRFVAARDAEGKLHTKSDVMRHAMSELHIADAKDVVMIGDRKFDVYGAKEFEMESIGVLWGYGDEEELLGAGAEHIAKNFEDLLKIL